MPTVAHIIRRRHSRKRRRRHESIRSSIWLTVLLIIPLLLSLAPLLAGLGLSVWLYLRAASYLPAPADTVFIDSAKGATRFYDRSGEFELYRVTDPLGEKRRWLRLDALPQYVIDAATLVELGQETQAAAAFDIVDVALQLWRYIIDAPGRPAEGSAATLVREALMPLTRNSGMDRRLLEIVLVAEVKRTRSANELLEWRLNSAYYGNDAYGIDAAANVYFGKGADRLSLAEAALLAKVAAAPSLNPVDAAVSSRERGADLLFELLNAELIDRAQFDAASASAVPSRSGLVARPDIAPSFVVYARAQAAAILDRLGLDGERQVGRGALRITTSLDLELQRQAECALGTHLARAAGAESTGDAGAACPAARSLAALPALGDFPPTAGALTMIDVRKGEIITMAGAADAPLHQPALVLQPFVYMDAFLRRELTPASMVYDLPRSYPGRTAELIYTPSNTAGIYRGPLNLRDALAAGLLPPVVEVASEFGIAPALRLARSLGFNSLNEGQTELEILERGGAVSVLDAAYTYSVVASLGAMRGVPAQPQAVGIRARDPVAVLSIADAEGNVLWDYTAADAQTQQSQIIEPSLAFMVNDILADDQARVKTLGQPDPVLRLPRKAAVLDGMSVDRRASWTVGYTPDLALVVNTNRADGAGMSLAPLQRAGSAPVWQALMIYAHERLGLPPSDWQSPPDIEEYLVCEISGLLPATIDHCPARRELLPAGSTLRRDNLWQTVEINRTTGQLATVHTPDDLRENVAYFVPPEDIMDWWIENDRPLPPSNYSADVAADARRGVRLTAPADYAYAGAAVEISGEIHRDGAESWQLDYGAEVNPEHWVALGDRQPVNESGSIATTWQTALLSGIHTLRLTVDFTDGSQETVTRLLTFDNTPPSVSLQTSDGTGTAYLPTVSLIAEVSDNLAIERVEFYLDDTLQGVDLDWPYGLAIEVEQIGEHEFRAVAFDQVDNRATSIRVVSVIDG